MASTTGTTSLFANVEPRTNNNHNHFYTRALQHLRTSRVFHATGLDLTDPINCSLYTIHGLIRDAEPLRRERQIADCDD